MPVAGYTIIQLKRLLESFFQFFSSPAVEDGCELPLDDVIIYLRKLDSIDD